MCGGVSDESNATRRSATVNVEQTGVLDEGNLLLGGRSGGVAPRQLDLEERSRMSSSMQCTLRRGGKVLRDVIAMRSARKSCARGQVHAGVLQAAGRRIEEGESSGATPEWTTQTKAECDGVCPCQRRSCQRRVAVLVVEAREVLKRPAREVVQPESKREVGCLGVSSSSDEEVVILSGEACQVVQRVDRRGCVSQAQLEAIGATHEALGKRRAGEMPSGKRKVVERMAADPRAPRVEPQAKRAARSAKGRRVPPSLVVHLRARQRVVRKQVWSPRPVEDREATKCRGCATNPRCARDCIPVNALGASERDL
jgi:hypothetical protein